ncbi:cyanase [Corynebacterium vitaeruminis]|uniref:cyanase n=1 Tax=Corynebacterium vitaeruminis TaxID=38305 RepID=UPI0028B17361|nr:cyanase [Corynebacterium vitaeruminis]
MQPIMDKYEAGKLVDAQRIRKGKTWAELAKLIDRPLVWSTSALLGSFPVPEELADKVCAELELGEDVREALMQQPTRAFDAALLDDPTIYRFMEAIKVHGPALKALVHEEFGDGIMSAINFQMDFDRREDPAGDRVVVTFDGKFLDYHW